MKQCVFLTLLTGMASIFSPSTGLAENFTPISIRPLVGTNCSQVTLELIGQISSAKGKTVKIKFISRDHNFTKPLYKIVKAKMEGTKKQRGQKIYTYEDYEYFSFDPSSL